LTEGIVARHAIFAAPHLLITVSTDSVLTAWRMQTKNQGFRRGDVQLTREATLRGHTSKVTCLAASASWSLLVSGTEVSRRTQFGVSTVSDGQDGNAVVWDTNRLRYTRLLQTTRSDPIKFCQVHEADVSCNHPCEGSTDIIGQDRISDRARYLPILFEWSSNRPYIPRKLLILIQFHPNLHRPRPRRIHRKPNVPQSRIPEIRTTIRHWGRITTCPLQMCSRSSDIRR
jgi:WD40 repeat protein